MTNLKQQLTELIDAFATAKATGNQRLIEHSATDLVRFLEGVQLSPVTQSEETDGGQE